MVDFLFLEEPLHRRGVVGVGGEGRRPPRPVLDAALAAYGDCRVDRGSPAQRHPGAGRRHGPQAQQGPGPHPGGGHRPPGRAAPIPVSGGARARGCTGTPARRPGTPRGRPQAETRSGTGRTGGIGGLNRWQCWETRWCEERAPCGGSSNGSCCSAIVVGGYFAVTGVAGVADVAPSRRPTGAGHRGHGGRPVRRGALARPRGAAPGGRATCGTAISPPTMVVTGSKEPGDKFTEAQASATWLEQHGVPPADIVEVGGNDSWTNLSLAAAALHQRGLTKVLIVTDGFHEDRSLAIASNVGLQAWPAPTTNSPSRGGRPFRTTPRRRWGWPWAGSSGTHGSTGWASLRSHPFGGGVIGNTAGSGPVIGGSSPPPRAIFPLRAPLRWGSECHMEARCGRRRSRALPSPWFVRPRPVRAHRRRSASMLRAQDRSARPDGDLGSIG